MKGCIKVLKDQPPNSVEGLLNALRSVLVPIIKKKKKIPAAQREMWLQPVSRLLNWTGAGCSRCELDELVPVHKQQTDLIPFSAVTHPPRRPAGDSVSCEPDPGWVSKPLHKGRLHVTPGPLAPSQISPTSPHSRSCWQLWVDPTSVCLCVWGARGGPALPGHTRLFSCESWQIFSQWLPHWCDGGW